MNDGIVKILTLRRGKIEGYLTGNALYNQWGLTTQVPNKLTIARRSRLPEKEISGYKINFVVRPFPFKEPDIPMLQLLDALTDIRQIPDTPPLTVVPLLAAKMKELHSSSSKPTSSAITYSFTNEYMPCSRMSKTGLFES
jgi:hypothetical protein